MRTIVPLPRWPLLRSAQGILPLGVILYLTLCGCVTSVWDIPSCQQIYRNGVLVVHSCSQSFNSVTYYYVE